MLDTYSDFEPETLRPEPESVQPATLRRVDRDDEGTRVMTIKHGAKSSTRSRVVDRVVPSPFPTPPHAMRPQEIVRAMDLMRPQMPSEPTWLRPSQNTMLPPPLHDASSHDANHAPNHAPNHTSMFGAAKPFSDFDFSEFEEPSDQMPVVHGHRTIAERLANPMTPEDAQLCWDHAQRMQQIALAQTQLAGEGWPMTTGLESGIRPAAMVPEKARQARSRVTKTRAIMGFFVATILGATAMASWRGDITEENVRYAGMQAQITAEHVVHGTPNVTRATLTRWK
jgi:hypothetical protein